MRVPVSRSRSAAGVRDAGAETATIWVMADDRPACAGKSYVEHQDTTMDGEHFAYRWHCPACGDSGSFADEAHALGSQFMPLMPVLGKLREQMLDQRAAFLVPSEGATGVMGQFMRLDVIRAPGLAEPMIGIPALSWVPDESKLENLTSVAAELEQENGPVTEAELRDVRAEWLGR